MNNLLLKQNANYKVQTGAQRSFLKGEILTENMIGFSNQKLSHLLPSTTVEPVVTSLPPFLENKPPFSNMSKCLVLKSLNSKKQGLCTNL